MRSTENKEETEYYIFGIRPAMEAIKAGKSIDKVFIQQGLKGEIFGEFMAMVKKEQINYQYVPAEKLNKITRKNHQGVVTFLSPIVYQNIENILIDLFEKGENPLLLICDHITDVRNFGAICRTAECAGVNAIVVPEKGSAQINADAIKTSAGALHTIPVCKVQQLKSLLLLLKEYGMQIIGCTEKSQSNYSSPDFTKPTAIIMGSEEKGIQNELLKLCDRKVKIPLMGTIASLNVSVASGIILYEAVRQRTEL